jgi:hypothetical protein
MESLEGSSLFELAVMKDQDGAEGMVAAGSYFMNPSESGQSFWLLWLQRFWKKLQVIEGKMKTHSNHFYCIHWAQVQASVGGFANPTQTIHDFLF